MLGGGLLVLFEFLNLGVGVFTCGVFNRLLSLSQDPLSFGVCHHADSITAFVFELPSLLKCTSHDQDLQHFPGQVVYILSGILTEIRVLGFILTF